MTPKALLIARILSRVRQESVFVEKSEYTLATLQRVLHEELK